MDKYPQHLMYCPVNGHLHSVLPGFGLDICPKCDQSLTAIPVQYPPSSDNATEKAGAEKDNIETANDYEEVERPPGFSYSVEYLDSGDNIIAWEPFSGPFDLAAARQDITTTESAIFDIVTVLKTTIIEDHNRRIWDITEIMKEGILNNPVIGAIVKCGKMNINSPALIEILTSVVSYYPSVNLEGGEISIKEPYPLIAHHLTELERYVNETQDGKAKISLANSIQSEASSPDVKDICPSDIVVEASKHVNIVLDFVDKIYKNMVKNELARYVQKKCTFRMLWLLFKPGDTIYHDTGGHCSAYVVKDVSMDPAILSKSEGKAEPYTISIWNLDFDGQYVGRCAYSVIIPYFGGERETNALKIFPSRFLDSEDGGLTRSRLEKNGKRWYELLRGGKFFYSGKLLDSPTTEASTVKPLVGLSRIVLMLILNMSSFVAARILLRTI
jgi:hypothetical protein